MSNRKRTDFNQQIRGVMAHYTLEMLFYIPTIARFWLVIQVRKFLANVSYIEALYNETCYNWNGSKVRAPDLR